MGLVYVWTETLIHENAYLAFFIQQVKDSKLRLDQFNTGLVIIKVDERPLNFFPHILILFQFEDVL